MAEVLGVVSSVIAIIDFTQKIIDYAIKVKEADDDRKRVMDEMGVVQCLVKRLSYKILAEGQGLPNTMEPMKQPLEGLAGLLKDLQDTLQASNFKWPYTTKDVDGKLVVIRGYIQNIQCVLAERQMSVFKFRSDICCLKAYANQQV